MATIPGAGAGLAAGVVQTQTAISSKSSDELGALITNISNKLERLVQSSKEQEYTAVKVLFLKWQDCNLDPAVENETLELQRVFRDQYGFDAGYSTDVFRIPSQLSEDALDAHVSQAKLAFSQLQTSEKKLMIVYYNGHGDINPQTKELMIGGGMQPAIPWNGIHEMLRNSTNFDVLLLLDCCFAARALKRLSDKTMEVLCAVSREVEASIIQGGRGSYFTSALIQNLVQCSSRTDGFLVSELASLLHHDSSLDDQSPNHVTISGHDRPIRLRPLNQVQATGPTPGVSNNGYNYEESLRKYLISLEVDGPNGPQTLNCLLDEWAEVTFISANAVQRLGLTLQAESCPGSPLITKQVSGNDGSTSIRVKMASGRTMYSDQDVFVWPGATFPTTGEIDMLIAWDFTTFPGLMAPVTDPRDPLLRADVDKWHGEWLYGPGQPYMNEKEKHIQRLTAVFELIQNELALRQP